MPRSCAMRRMSAMAPPPVPCLISTLSTSRAASRISSKTGRRPTTIVGSLSPSWLAICRELSYGRLDGLDKLPGNGFVLGLHQHASQDRRDRHIRKHVSQQPTVNLEQAQIYGRFAFHQLLKHRPGKSVDGGCSFGRGIIVDDVERRLTE